MFVQIRVETADFVCIKTPLSLILKGSNLRSPCYRNSLCTIYDSFKFHHNRLVNSKVRMVIFDKDSNLRLTKLRLNLFYKKVHLEGCPTSVLNIITIG